MEDKVRKAIKEKAEDAKMPCAVALGLARDFKVSPKKIGEILNEEKIKVVKCQLGCFE